MTDIKALLAGAKLPERTVPVCLRGDLVAEHERLERQLEAAERKTSDSLAGNGSGEIVEQMDAVEEQMRESTETFTLRALPHRRTPRDDRPTWHELVQRHPPRRENDEIVEDDQGPGVNTATFYDDLIRLCTVSPKLDDEDWDFLFAVLSEGQFAELSMAAAVLNRSGVDIPFSRAASRVKRRTAGE